MAMEAAWEALHAHYTTSLQAQHRLAALHTKITSTRLTIDYPDTSCVFLTKFDRMLKDHPAMCPPGGGLTDHLKCTYLQNAIMGRIPNLAMVFSEQQSYDDIISALSTAIPGFFVLPGTTYDRLFQRAYVQATICCDQTRSAQGSSRRAKTHHQHSTDSSESDDESGSSSGLDVPSSEIRAFKAQYRKFQKKKGLGTRRVNLTKETWDKLSDSAKTGWEMLSREEKDNVLADAANIKSAKGRAHMTEAADHQDPEPEPDPDPGPASEPEYDRQAKASDSSKPTKPSPGSLQSILNTGGSRNTNQTRHMSFQSHATFVSSSGGYRMSKHRGDVASSSLIDRGANGGLAGSGMQVISVDPSRKLTITGIDNHQMPDLDVVQAGAYVTSHKGPVIAIFHQYAHIKTGASIHSSLQLEHYKLQVDDRSLRAGGTQSISTPEGYMFPLDIIDGLVYLRMRPFTDEEYAALPHDANSASDESSN
jgi:hypothetical protein